VESSFFRRDLPFGSYGSHAFERRFRPKDRFIEDATKLPGASSFRASNSQNAALGAHINEAMSKPGDLPRAEDGNAALEVTDLLYAETQEPLRKTITGQTVEVVGQYLGAANDQFKLVRMFIWCCAADARPIYVPVEVSGPVDVSDMEWVKVTGTAEFSINKGQTHVLLKAASVEASDPPEEAMLY
jgi:uncharacterized membrane protein YcgQ (UPF0703/DUF1980 family)